jgi:hypothetical protein
VFAIKAMTGLRVAAAEFALDLDVRSVAARSDSPFFPATTRLMMMCFQLPASMAPISSCEKQRREGDARYSLPVNLVPLWMLEVWLIIPSTPSKYGNGLLARALPLQYGQQISTTRPSLRATMCGNAAKGGDSMVTFEVELDTLDELLWKEF